MNKKKTILLISIIVITLILIVGVALAAFSYNKTGANSQLVVGDIYMHYRETTTNINIGSVFPTNSYIEGEYFEFTIDGKNTNEKGNILYNIQVTKGDGVTGKNRIEDKFLKFRLVKVENNQEIELINDKNYETINNTTIYSDMINKQTNTEVVYTYRLYVWISNEVSVGNIEGVDYTSDEWNNLFASVKVNVNGKYVEGEVLTNTIKSKLGTEGVVAVNTDGELYDVNDSTQKIREYRYSGPGNYCTYTDGTNDYNLNVEGDTCPVSACKLEGIDASDTEVIIDDSDIWPHYAALLGVETFSCSDMGGTSIGLKTEGSTPTDSGIRNYIEFNEELWRIVGVFDDEVKIMKNTALSSNIYESDTYTSGDITYQLTYDVSDAKYQYFYYNYSNNTFKADWSTSGVMHYLNDETGNSYYTSHLSTKAKNLITETTYYLGNINSYNDTSITSYNNERKNVVCESTVTQDSNNNNCNIWYGNEATWTGKIGILHASDYGYAANSEYWSSTVLNNYSESAYLSNWMNDNDHSGLVLLSPPTVNPKQLLFSVLNGEVGVDDSDIFTPIKPVVTLKSDTIVISGNGSYSSPYKLLES